MTHILSLDIGGSKTQIALWQCTCAAPILQKTVTFPTDYADERALIPRLRQFTADADDVAAAAIAFAGAENADGALKLTNNPCTLDITNLRQALPPNCRLTVLNDLAALAYALNWLPGAALQSLNPQADFSQNHVVKLAAACGTGFGAAALLPGGRCLPTEAGHCRFAPANAEQAALCASIGGHITNETLLSGAGLSRIHTALGTAAPPLAPAAVNARAAAGDVQALQAVRLFSGALGAALGNLALVTLCSGGVYLAGGVCQKLAPLLDAAALVANFVIPGPFAAALAKIPVYLITDPAAVSLGAAVYADRTLLG